MTYKPTMSMDSALSHVETTSIPFAGLFAKLKSAATNMILVGYQDETGFHPGVKQDETEMEWPNTW